MRVAGEMDALRAEITQEMSAAGVPEGASIVYLPEPPVAMRAIAVTAADAWFAVKSAGAPAIVKRAESEEEKAGVRRAADAARAEQAVHPEQRDASLDARFEADNHPGTTQETTPDNPSNDKNNPWHLEQEDRSVPPKPKAPTSPHTTRLPDPLTTLKALNAQLERLAPKMVGIDPTEKSFLLHAGYELAEIDRGDVKMTPALRRDYVRWLASETRATSYKLLNGAR